MAEILELSDKDFKVIMIKMPQQAILNMLETNEKIGNLRKEMESVNK